MSAGSPEQRNPYKGSPPRPWLRLLAAGGASQDVDLVADTGNPAALILSASVLARFAQQTAPDMNSNFGPLLGGWVDIEITEIGLKESVLAYGSDAVVKATKASSPDFEGLAGLPWLRLREYGGDATSFWIR